MGNRGSLALALALLMGCSTAGSDGPGGGGGGGGGGGDGGGVGDPDGEADAAAGPDAAPSVVRFVAMGDTGTASADQYAVAEAVRATCEVRGCDFVVLLGDNLYDSGAAAVDDPIWMEKFEAPYASIDLPFYPVMGNHDYGGDLFGEDYGGLGNEFDRAPIAIAYSQVSGKWQMPATHYTRRIGPLGLIFLDTNSILWERNDHGDQRAWYPTALAEVEGATWTIAVGHHPYRSNGAHGNAGDYEGIEGLDIPIPIDEVNGTDVRAFFDDLVCGSVDLYMAGHDHNRQWLDESASCGGTELIVNGAGAKVKPFDDRGNEARWQDDTTEGFLHVELDATSLTGRFYDKTGAMNFEYTLTAP